jgi:hypothetical protein
LAASALLLGAFSRDRLGPRPASRADPFQKIREELPRWLSLCKAAAPGLK